VVGADAAEKAEVEGIGIGAQIQKDLAWMLDSSIHRDVSDRGHFLGEKFGHSAHAVKGQSALNRDGTASVSHWIYPGVLFAKFRAGISQPYQAMVCPRFEADGKNEVVSGGCHDRDERNIEGLKDVAEIAVDRFKAGSENLRAIPINFFFIPGTFELQIQEEQGALSGPKASVHISPDIQDIRQGLVVHKAETRVPFCAADQEFAVPTRRMVAVATAVFKNPRLGMFVVPIHCAL
jgi:hypothetical protein